MAAGSTAAIDKPASAGRHRRDIIAPSTAHRPRVARWTVPTFDRHCRRATEVAYSIQRRHDDVGRLIPVMIHQAGRASWLEFAGHVAARAARLRNGQWRRTSPAARPRTIGCAHCFTASGSGPGRGSPTRRWCLLGWAACQLDTTRPPRTVRSRDQLCNTQADHAGTPASDFAPVLSAEHSRYRGSLLDPAISSFC